MMTGSATCRFTAIALMLAVGSTVASCDSIGNPLEAIAGSPSSPDEFAVLSRKPLQMPSSVSLPEPRLGETSALEPDPSADAVAALLGTPTSRPSAPASAGEAALLSAANASQQQSEIRTTLALEAEGPKPGEKYVPPSLFDIFSDDDPELPEGEIIDPAAESQRLQAEGRAPTPVDPRVAPEGEVAAPSDPEQKSPFTAKQGT